MKENKNTITFNEFIHLIKSGYQPVVEMGTLASDISDYDPGMLTKCISVSYEGEGVYKVEADFSSYVEYNKNLEIPNWIHYTGKNSGSELLKWSDTSYYPKDYISDFYISEAEWYSGSEAIFKEHTNSLFSLFQASGEDNYVKWLEKKLAPYLLNT